MNIDKISKAKTRWRQQHNIIRV